MARMALAALALAGCSFMFDNQPPEVVLGGFAPDLRYAPKLRQETGLARRIMVGTDGASWAVLSTSSGLRVNAIDVQAVRLAHPFMVESYSEIVLSIGETALYGLIRSNDSTGPTRVFMRKPGGWERRFEDLAPGGGTPFPSPQDRALVWLPNRPDQPAWLGLTDKSWSREINREVARSISLEQGPSFDREAEWLISYTSDAILAERIGGGQPVSFPMIARSVRLGPAPGTLVVCMNDGIDMIDLAAPSRRHLTDDPCQAPFVLDERFVYYVSGKQLRVLPLEGGAARVLAPFEGETWLAAVGGGHAATTTAYHGTGRAFIDGRPFMERGRDATISRDGTRVRWIERAATTEGVGELLSMPVEGGEILRLALNVRHYEELADGRVIAAANQAFAGYQNRVVVIDEVSRTARYVAERAKAFEVLPNENEALVAIVGPPKEGYTDWVVAPIPPRETP